MLFTSLEFLFFLPIVFLIYWRLKSKQFQNFFLLSASYLFYGCWDWRFLILIAISSLVDYLVSLRLAESSDPSYRKRLLYLSLLVNLGFLFVFKYFNFFKDSLFDLLSGLGVEPSPFTLNVILPVGISFYTFQSLGYTLDVYRNKIKPTHNWVDFFTYVAFFPQLVAGPIERASVLLPQLNQLRTFNRRAGVQGLRQILWGFFKKVVIADNAATIVDIIFENYHILDGTILILGAVLFAFQIYCDFSGYSDIAIGIAKLFGIRLNKNFAVPYFSRDIGEFWRRWHISLSTWFRDYLFIPLGGSRVDRRRHLVNIVIVFLVSGLWHGANWTFVAWGGIHALLYVILLISTDFKKQVSPDLKVNLVSVMKMIVTFSVVTVAWVFFRAPSIQDALAYIYGFGTFDNIGSFPSSLRSQAVNGVVIFGSICFMLIMEWKNRTADHGMFIIHRSKVLRWSLYLFLTLAVMEYFNDEKPFIYFQF